MSLSAPSPRRGSRWVLCVTMMLLFLVYAGTVALDLVVNDVLSASLGSWRIATTGQPWFDSFPLEQIVTPPSQLWTGTAGNGHVAVTRSPGAIAVGVPPYLLAGGGSDPEDFSILPGAMFAAALATLSVAMLFGSVRHHLSDLQAFACVGALALATPMWTVNANSLWTHSLTVFGIAGMSWATVHRRWWLVGIFGGLALSGRLHVALIVAVLGVGLALYRRRPVIAVIIGSTSGCFLILCSVWSRWMYGTWNPQGGYPTGATYVQRTTDSEVSEQVVNQLGLWIAPDRGLLVWTPLLILLLPALMRGWRELDDWVKLMAFAGICYSIVQGQLNGFTGGSGVFGYRLTLEVLVCLFPAYALSAHRMGAIARALVGPILGLQFAAMALGAISEGFFLAADRAWYDNSLALALRTVPVVWGWLILMAIVGWLAGVMWRQRASADHEPSRL